MLSWAQRRLRVLQHYQRGALEIAPAEIKSGLVNEWGVITILTDLEDSKH